MRNVRRSIVLAAVVAAGALPITVGAQVSPALYPVVHDYSQPSAAAWFDSRGNRIILANPRFAQYAGRSAYDFILAHETAHHLMHHSDQYAQAHAFGFFAPYNARELELRADCAAAEYFVRAGRTAELPAAVRAIAQMAEDATHPLPQWRVLQIQQCAQRALAQEAPGRSRYGSSSDDDSSSDGRRRSGSRYGSPSDDDSSSDGRRRSGVSRRTECRDDCRADRRECIDDGRRSVDDCWDRYDDCREDCD